MVTWEAYKDSEERRRLTMTTKAGKWLKNRFIPSSFPTKDAYLDAVKEEAVAIVDRWSLAEQALYYWTLNRVASQQMSGIERVIAKEWEAIWKESKGIK